MYAQIAKVALEVAPTVFKGIKSWTKKNGEEPVGCETSIPAIEPVALRAMKRAQGNGPLTYKYIRETGISVNCSDEIKQAMTNVRPALLKWREQKKKQAQLAAAAEVASGQIPGAPVVYAGQIIPPLPVTARQYILPAIIALAISLFFILRKR